MEHQNFFSFFLECAEEYPDSEFLVDLRDDRTFSYEEALSGSLSLAGYLSDQGVGRGDHVAIFMDNSPYWRIADLAVQALGAVNVSRYTEDVDELEYVLEDSDSEYLLQDNDVGLDVVMGSLDRREVERIVEDYEPYSAVEAVDNASSDSLNSIVYTSGTKSRPKGVMLTQKNVLSQIPMIGSTLDRPDMQGFEVDSSDGLASLVPEWHMYQRAVENFGMSRGVTVYYDSLKGFRRNSLFSEDISVVPGVPRLWQAVRDEVVDGLEGSLSFSFGDVVEKYGGWMEDMPGVGTLYDWIEGEDFTGIDLYGVFESLYGSAADHVSGRDPGLYGRLSEFFVRRTVGRIVRKKLGDKKLVLSGGSYVPGEIEEFFEVMGMPLVNGYGMTETSPLVSASTYGDGMYSIGRPMEGLEARINEDDVLEVRGPNVFEGYYGMPEESEKVFTDDGFFVTGDRVEWTDEGCIRYVDRADDVIVRSNGENVSPAKLESTIETAYESVKESLVVRGERLGMDDEIVAVLVPDEEEREELYEKFRSSKKKVLKEIRNIFREREFPSYERVDEVVLYSGEEGIPKTSTLKKMRDDFVEMLRKNHDLVYV